MDRQMPVPSEVSDRLGEFGKRADDSKLTRGFGGEFVVAPRRAAMRLLDDLQAAEDVVQDVLVSALDRWPLTGVPANPVGWLMTACRKRALNRCATRAARDRGAALAALLDRGHIEEPDTVDLGIPDDRLRLMFICCHPVPPPDGQAALTLRMLGGLPAGE